MNKTLASNWWQLPTDIWYLSTFLKPRQPDGRFLDVEWSRALGEPHERVVERFIDHGVLMRSSVAVRLDTQFTRDQLRSQLYAKGLSPSGSKDVLVERLIAHDPAAAELLASSAVYQCSDKGQALTEQYLSNPRQLIENRDSPGAVPLPDMVADVMGSDANAGETLDEGDVRRIMRWLLLEGVVVGDVANAVYALYKEKVAQSGEDVSDLTRRWFQTLNSWCHVPAGFFSMGNQISQRYYRPYLSDYYISQFPITNQQYAVFVRDTRHKPPRHWESGRVPLGLDKHPVVYVSWYDAVAFCRWATERVGHQIRLPSEAEWEKAARGSNNRFFPWGGRWDSLRCNTPASGIGTTTPVDHYPNGRSSYGVYDMVGNVWEWTASLHKPYPYKPDDGREDLDAMGSRVLRGCSWDLVTDVDCVAARFSLNPDNSSDDYGFRVVASLTRGESTTKHALA
jgi:formylglycine-generating enzyme required for sulfatase activity